MGNTKISVTEADIDDELMKQHGVSLVKRSNIKLPRPSFKVPSLRLKSPLAIIALIVLVLLVGGGLGYQKYASLKQENQRLSNPEATAEEEANLIKGEVAQLIELPNETPTIATVIDVEKLRSQPFFASAQNGDRVLLFSQAKKAILYRPSTKKLVEVAPINLGDTGVAGTSTTQPSRTTTTPTATAPKKP